MLHSAVSNTVCPLVTGRGRFLLLWGAGAVDDDDDELTEFYDRTPLAAVYGILAKAFERGLRTADEPGAPELPGGWVYAVGNAKTYRQAATALYEETTARLGTNQKLRFVYDLATCDTPFANLEYLHDAMRRPTEQLSDEGFSALYGIPRRLAFRPSAVRLPYRSDWWASVY